MKWKIEHNVYVAMLCFVLVGLNIATNDIFFALLNTLLGFLNLRAWYKG